MNRKRAGRRLRRQSAADLDKRSTAEAARRPTGKARRPAGKARRPAWEARGLTVEDMTPPGKAMRLKSETFR
jgi:hypothetical protein